MSSTTVSDNVADLSVAPLSPNNNLSLTDNTELQKKLKRSDPFQFGSRFLTQEDDVFEFNAWDHVEVDDTFKEYAEKQYEMQRQSPVSDFDKNRYNSDPAKWWDTFYKNNASNFFKDRKWLQQEFPILDDVCQENSGPKVLLEIGAGAGNTAFPILLRNKNPQLRIHACDYSKKAVEVMRDHEAYDANMMQADVWDVSGERLPPGLGEASVDVILMVFIFSALSPAEWERAVANVYRLLKPGGTVCLRDYGRGDLAQVRFKKGRYLDENFYVRGDGTRVYFFDPDELRRTWTDDGECSYGEEEEDGSANRSRFTVQKLAVDRRLLVNRATRVKMHRCWLQAQFIK